VVLDVPLHRTEAAHEKQHHADAEVNHAVVTQRSSRGQVRRSRDAEVGEDDAHPDLGRERLEE